MKKLFYSFLVLASTITCSIAQNVDIPDPIFKNYLLGIPELNTNKDQEISNNEAFQWSSKPREINVSNMGITSLKGIEAFEQLRKLDCSYNQLKQLNLQNHYYSIDTINLSHNMIDSISSPQSYLHIKYVDWSYNQLNKTPKTNTPYISIDDLNLRHNNIQSFSSDPWYYLSGLDLSYNQLTSLDVKNMYYLSYLNVGHNQLQTLLVPYGLNAIKCDYNALVSVCVSDVDMATKKGEKDANTIWENCYKVTQENCVGSNLSTTGACDDFKLAPNSGTNEYLLETDKPRWSGVPEPNEKAYMGLFWSETINKNGFSAIKTRSGDGVMRYKITQPKGVYEPITVSFGSYADGNLEKKFALDLSQNSTLEFTVKNGGKSDSLNILVSLQDINQNDLVFKNDTDMDTTAIDLYYNYSLQIGNNSGNFSEFWTSYSINRHTFEDVTYDGGISKFSFDFSKAICGKMKKDPYDGNMYMQPSPGIKFDYSNVTMVKIIVHNYYDKESDVKDLIDYPIEIYNFRIGSSVPLLQIQDSKQSDNSDKFYEVYDLMGQKVAEGKESELHLKHEQIYIFKSQHEAFKKVIFE